jgi:hypothetical protein
MISLIAARSAWLAAAGASAVMIVAAFEATGTTGYESFGWANAVLGPLLTMSFASVGATIVARLPRNRIGWLLTANGVLFAMTYLGGWAIVWSLNRDEVTTQALVMEWLSVSAFYVMIGVLWPRLLILLPDGRLPSGRWRVVNTLQLVAIVIMVVLILAPSADSQLGEPIGIDALAGLAAMLEPVGSGLVVFLLFAGAASLVVRFRRGNEVARAQLKWIAWVASMLAVGFALSLFLPNVPGLDNVIGFINFFLLALLPVTIGIAVLRYRLYEIDRIISRTPGWAIVTGLLVAVFAGAVIALQALLAPVTGGDTLAVAGSTLLAAALFAPLRRRIQHIVDRRFDRGRHDGERLLIAFGERLRDEVDLGVINADVRATADQAVRPVRTDVWLRVVGERS